jgi:hypothetical protein
MKQTIDLVVKGSKHPLSIIIIGLGNDAFISMKTLDANEEELVDSHGRKMERDICSFVPFRDVGDSMTKLVRMVLDEVPREIVNFYTARRIFPNPPRLADMEDMSETGTPFQFGGSRRLTQTATSAAYRSQSRTASNAIGLTDPDIEEEELTDRVAGANPIK